MCYSGVRWGVSTGDGTSSHAICRWRHGRERTSCCLKTASHHAQSGQDMTMVGAEGIELVDFESMCPFDSMYWRQGRKGTDLPSALYAVSGHNPLGQEPQRRPLTLHASASSVGPETGLPGEVDSRLCILDPDVLAPRPGGCHDGLVGAD